MSNPFQAGLRFNAIGQEITQQDKVIETFTACVIKRLGEWPGSAMNVADDRNPHMVDQNSCR